MSREFKEGDKVVCPRGYGEVIAINETSSLPIRVRIDSKNYRAFTADGKFAPDDEFPTLFHVDRRPSQWVVKKEVKFTQWANVYRDATHMYDTEEGAKRAAGSGAIAVAVKMTGGYKVLE